MSEVCTKCGEVIECPECNPGDGWMPIETAPKDGTVILTWRPFKEVYGDAGQVNQVRWDNKAWRMPGASLPSDIPEHTPTHWMAPPAPPAKRDECLHKCKDGEIISHIGGEPSIPKPCPIHGPKSGEGA